MAVLRLKIDVSGTVGDEAWRGLKQFDQIQSADFGLQFGSGGRCNHPLNQPHNKKEWVGAEIRLQTPLLAELHVHRSVFHRVRKLEFLTRLSAPLA